MSSADALATLLVLLRKNPRAVAPGTVVQIVVPDAAVRTYFTFADDGVVATAGIADKVDLTLSLGATELARFLDDSLDFDHALKTKRVKVMGDPSLLLALARAMRAAA